MTTLLTRIKSAWPPRKAPEPTYVDDRLNYWADARPHDPALSHGGRAWTWAEAHDRVHRAAYALRDLGVARGDVVAYVGSGHLACVELTLAAGSIGAATAVVDGAWDVLQVAEALTAYDAVVVVVDARLADAVATVQTRMQRIIPVTSDGADPDEWEPLLAVSTPCADGTDVVEDDVCLILHPDGPRGDAVRLTHRDVVSGTAGVTDVAGGLLAVLGRVNAGEPSTL